MEKEIFVCNAIDQMSVTDACECLAIKSYILENKIEVYVLRTATTPKDKWTLWINRNEYYRSLETNVANYNVNQQYIEVYHLSYDEIVMIIELINNSPTMDVLLMLKIAKIYRNE